MTTLELSPSEHAGLSLIRCAPCGRPAYAGTGQTECDSCRTAPKENWWAKAYGGQKNPPPPRRIMCRTCRTVRYGPLNIPGGEVQACSRCMVQPRTTGKDGPVLAVTPLRTAVSATCTNATIDDGCLVRAGGCAVLRSGRCRHFEVLLPLVGDRARAAYARLHSETVREDGPPARKCLVCGATVRIQRRYCPGCARTRRRESGRRAVAKHRGEVLPV